MSPGWIDKLKNHRASVLVALLLIVGLGAYFRLADLGLAAFRADEGFFWDIFQMKHTPGEIFDKWMELQGLSGQFPFSAAFTKWFVQFFGLPVTHFTVRVPSALWGIVTILAAYGAGRAFGGTTFGLALAWVLAVNPYHIQLSREAYHYPPLVCGAFLGFWAALWIVDHVHTGKPFTPLFYGISVIGFFLLTYAQPSGWPLALLLGAIFLYGTARVWKKGQRATLPFLATLAACAIASIPLLVSPWGLKQQLQSASSEVQASMLRIFGSGPPFFEALWRIITSYGWGDTFLRGTFTLLVIGLAFWVCVRKIKVDGHYLVLLVFLVGGFGFAVVSLRSTGRPFASRYVVSLTPLFLTLLTVGLVRSAELFKFVMERKPPSRTLFPCGLLLIATMLWAWPAYLCTRLTGKPTPYKGINAWVDANLPHGTLVLVDRWFEPWCELRVEPSTNVIYTYTIPNEPLENFINFRWRDSAVAFLTNNLDAAYLEIAKTFWESPQVGPWHWPREYFARREVFTNDAGLKLRELGLAAREDYYTATTNRLVVELFYNKREDVLNRAKAAGQRFVVFYSDGWGYWKNGPGWNQTATPDYRDWRVMQGAAQIDLYNTGDIATNVTLSVRGAPAGSAKEVKASTGASFMFPANQISQWKIGPILVQPGKTTIHLEDDHWTKAKVPLLAEGLSVAVSTPDSK